MRFSIEQKVLAISYALIGAAVATRIILAWLDRSLGRAFGGEL